MLLIGSSISNPSTGCTSPASSDDGNNIPDIVNGEENQIEDDPPRQVIKKHSSYGSSFQWANLTNDDHVAYAVRYVSITGIKAGQQ